MPATDREHARAPKFDAQAYLDSAGLAKTIQYYRRGQIIHAQGDSGVSVLYVQQGSVRLSVLSQDGKEAVIATLRAGDFFGDEALTGRPERVAAARAVTACTILAIEKETMARLLHEHHEFSDRFISYVLTRNTQIESDLIDQMCSSSEQRLARALLLLAQCGSGLARDSEPVKVSQETLAKTIGTTRTRVNFFMNKFRNAGYIDYSSAGVTVSSSLASVLLAIGPASPSPPGPPRIRTRQGRATDPPRARTR